MRLKRLVINRLPGITQPFEIEPSGAGVNIVFGPNAIGKSSICRAVEALYWDDRGPSDRTLVTGLFELGGDSWRADRDGSRLRWRCGGEDRVRPSLPASHSHRCFFLRLWDLIDPSLNGTQDIASHIRRQMSGGFDLSRIVEDHFPGVSNKRIRGSRDVFNKTEEEVGRAEGTHKALQRRADKLEILKAELNVAEKAACRLPFVDRAIGLAIRTEKYRDVTKQIANLPDVLANLTGEEIEQIEKLQVRVNKLNERGRVLESKRDTARRTQRDSALPAELDKSQLAVWRKKAEEFENLERELQSARTDCAKCRAELGAALSALGGGDVDQVALTVGEHGQLFDFLRAAEDQRAQKNAIKWKLRLLAPIEQSDGSQTHLENLRGAVDALRRWLRAPAPDTLSDRLRARRSWILLAVALSVLGAGLAVFVDPQFGLLVATAAGVMVPVILLRGTKAALEIRTNAQQEFARFSQEAPDAWDDGPVERRLRNLEREVASIDARLQRTQITDVDRRNLGSQLTEIEEAEPLLAKRRDDLRESLKLDAIPQDAELVDFARALHQLRENRNLYSGALGRVHHLEARYASLLSNLTDVLQRHGEPTPEDATAAKVCFGNLSDRNSKLVKALDDERQTDFQLDQVSHDRRGDHDSIRNIYKEASLNDGDQRGLTELLELLPQYRELKKNANHLKAQIDLYREELEIAGEAELVSCEGATLGRLKNDFSAAAAKAHDLQRDIVEIEGKVNDAKSGNNLQDLIARKEKTRADLQDLRDEALFAEAGRFLVSTVEKEYEQNQMPRIFERARGHFSNFTHHGYELRLSRDSQAPRLLAVDLTSREEREINELSDGTRAQLLLASRMAFAEEVEHGQTLPLFLDEALDQSDPARFEAIARSLGRLAKDQGRQIFYLTSDPQDRDRFRHALEAEKCVVAAEIDLGLIRRKTASVTGPTMLQVPLRSVVPAPDGASTEEYGVTLGVPAFAPALGYAPQHFFYVLFDDLNLLRDFLVNSIEHAGQWETVSGTPLAEKLGARSITSQEIDLRVSLLGVFCDAWNQGRSRAIDRDVLMESGAVSPRYLDYVVAISGELEGDPERLLAVVRAKNDLRLRGFRQRSVETLEGYLRDNGYLDDRPVLEESELTVRALTSPPANELSDGVASDLLRRWWVWATKMSDGSE